MNIFQDLENLNDGFDAEGVMHFSETHFEKVLARVELLGLGINGIETWKDEEFHMVEVFEDYSSSSQDAKWYKKGFDKLRNDSSDLLFSATYFVPQNQLKNA